MSAFIQYTVRANHESLENEELHFTNVCTGDYGQLCANITVVNDAGSTTIICVDLNDIKSAIEMIEAHNNELSQGY